jgi:hypothetical protein
LHLIYCYMYLGQRLIVLLEIGIIGGRGVDVYGRINVVCCLLRSHAELSRQCKNVLLCKL